MFKSTDPTDSSGNATPVPLWARGLSITLTLITITVLTFCFCRRLRSIKSWRNAPLTSILILTIYGDNFCFVFSAAVASKTFNINESYRICDGLTLICLFFYMSSKIFTYFFLVEKVYIVRGASTTPVPRLKTKLWCFNFFGVICPFMILVILNFVYRETFFKDGTCYLGLHRPVLDPLIAFDTVINVYLTSLFLSPLRKCYSYKHNSNSRLKTMVLRTFVASCTTLVAAVTNLTILTVFDGEPAYICLMSCSTDILFSCIVLHWATSVDRPTDNSSNTAPTPPKSLQSSRGHVSIPGSSKVDHYIELEDQNPNLTTKIEAIKGLTGQVDVHTNAIKVETRHVQEIELGSFETADAADTRWGRHDSTERIVSPPTHQSV